MDPSIAIDRPAINPGDLVTLTSSALMQLATDAPNDFSMLVESQRTGGRVVAASEQCVTVDVGIMDGEGQMAPLQVPWNPQYPFRTVLPVSDSDGAVVIPGQTSVHVHQAAPSMPPPSSAPAGEFPEEPPTNLPRVPAVHHAVGNMPIPQFAMPLFGLPQQPPPGPDLTRRVVPVRVCLAVQFITQILTLRQSAIGYATSLLAEHGLAKAHRPKLPDEGESWKGGSEDEEERPRPLPPMPTVNLTKEENDVYKNALCKLDTWMMQDDDDLPWNRPTPPAGPPALAAEAALGSEPGPT